MKKIKGYNLKNYIKFTDITIKIWGWNGIDWCYLILECSGDWVCLVTKDSPNSNGDNSLEGLVIDWHLAEYDYSAGVDTAPVLDTGLAHQPTYAYA